MKHAKSNKITLDRLPDEILIRILSQSVLPLSALQVMQRVSVRICALVNYVLRYKRLPAIHLDISIDQEGKSRITTGFQFDQLSTGNATINFIPSQPHIPKRYYADKAAPVIRLVRVTDTYAQPNSRLLSQSSYTSSDTVDQKDQAEKKHQKRKKQRTKSIKLQAQRNGTYRLEKSTGFPFCTVTCFNLTYQISSRKQNEYYTLLLACSFSFDYLMKQLSTDNEMKTTKTNYSALYNMTRLIKRCF